MAAVTTQSSNTAADFSVAASGRRGVTTGGGAAAARRAAARRADRRAAGWAHVHPARTKVRSPACPRARCPGSAPAGFRWARARRSLRPRAARDIDRARLLAWQAREDRPAAPWCTRVHRVRCTRVHRAQNVVLVFRALLQSVTTQREGEEGKTSDNGAKVGLRPVAPQGARPRGQSQASRRGRPSKGKPKVEKPSLLDAPPGAAPRRLRRACGARSLVFGEVTTAEKSPDFTPPGGRVKVNLR